MSDRQRAVQRGICLAAIVGLAAFGAPAHAIDLNGYTPAAGQGDIALSITSESYDHFWVGTKKVADPGLGEVKNRSLTLWGRYGVTDRLSIVANIPYVDTDSDGLGGFSESSLQDITVLARFLAVRHQGSGGTVQRLVVGLGARTPLTNYKDNLPVDVGDGTTDALARVVYQVEHGNLYFAQQIGYDLRGGDAPNGFPFLTELGYTFGRTTANLFYQRYIADGGTDIGDPGFTFPSNQDEYTRLGAKVYVRINDTFGAALSGFTTLDGRNSGDVTGFSLAGVFHFGS